MADESKRYSRRAIRQLLLAAFTAEELRDLFYFSRTPELQAVPDQFAPGDSYPTMVRKAVRYCDSRYLLGELLAEVKEANPRAYDKFEDMLRAPPGAMPSQARPQWLVLALVVALAVIVVGVAVVLVLVMRGPSAAEPTPTEVALATETITPTQTEPPTAAVRAAATDTPEPSTFTPTSTTSPSPTATDTPTPTSTASLVLVPTLTPLPKGEREFIVVYYGDDGVRLRAGPGTTYPAIATLEEGTRLKVEGGPEMVGDMRWWFVRTDKPLLGWVAEWASGIRLVKPFFEIGDPVVVANPMSTGNVNLWYGDCEYSVVLSRGMSLWVGAGPRRTMCEDPDDVPTLTERQWWQVDSEDGYRGWVADFSIFSGGGSVQAVLVAPRWYVELTAQ